MKKILIIIIIFIVIFLYLISFNFRNITSHIPEVKTISSVGRIIISYLDDNLEQASIHFLVDNEENRKQYNMNYRDDRVNINLLDDNQVTDLLYVISSISITPINFINNLFISDFNDTIISINLYREGSYGITLILGANRYFSVVLPMFSNRDTMFFIGSNNFFEELICILNRSLEIPFSRFFD